jgi:hypothetical protein
MDPQYFAHTLTIYEAEHYVKGLNRREKRKWERSRYEAFHAMKPHYKNFKFADMAEFPWEKERDAVATPRLTAEEQEQELAALRARARAQDEEYLKRKANGIG